MPSDLDLVNLCAQIYAGTGEWDHLDTGADDGVFWALRTLDGISVAVLRGSITAHDWVEDFRAFAVKTRFGSVHFGFYEGMEKMWGELSRMTTHPVIVTGHSLGAARADILCALMVAGGRPPVRRAVFGEPKPGLPDFAQFIKGVPGESYRTADAHGHDLVTDVPITLPWEFDFVHPTPVVDVLAHPAVEIGIFSFHHIQVYQAAMAAAQKETAE